ncbi:hypothetical protein GPALN_012171 [Globodera pallida]|nr:hypothetical protein GPALN_012171 [Globodera pallida]
MEKKAGEETKSGENHPMIEKKEEINPTQQKLIDEVDALRRELAEIKKEKKSRKRRTVIQNKEKIVNKAKTEAESKEKEEGKRKNEEKKDEGGKKGTEDDVILVEHLEETQREVDEISLNLEEEEKFLFTPPKGAENEALGFWQSCLNKAKSRRELEEARSKAKRPIDPFRLVKGIVRSAELSIEEKESEAIPPEGKRLKVETIRGANSPQFTDEEEKRRKLFAARTPPSGLAFGNSSWADEGKNEWEHPPRDPQSILNRLEKLRSKAREFGEEIEHLTREVEEVNELNEWCGKPGTFPRKEIKYWEHDSRWRGQSGRGRGNWPQTRGRPFSGDWRGGGRGWRSRGAWTERGAVSGQQMLNDPDVPGPSKTWSQMAGWA